VRPAAHLATCKGSAGDAGNLFVRYTHGHRVSAVAVTEQALSAVRRKSCH